MSLSTFQKCLIGTVIALPIGGYFYARNAANNFKFDYSGLSIDGLSVDGSAQATINFVLSSIAGIEFIIEGLYLDVYVDSTFVGTATQSAEIIVPKSGSIPISMKANINVLSVAGLALEIAGAVISGGSVNINYSLQGVVPIQVNIPVIKYLTINYPVAISSNYAASVA